MADGAHDLLGWIARAVGLFYLLGGLLTVRAGRTETFLDDAIARIGGEPTDPAERLRGWSMLAIGLLTAASGLLLVLLLKAAVYAFLAKRGYDEDTCRHAVETAADEYLGRP